MAETAIVVPVIEAEAVVGDYRRRHTAGGAEGMPPHLTLLVPFTDSDRLDDERSMELASVLFRFAPIDVAFTRCAYFAEGPVLYLEPEPHEPFVEMTEAIVAAFPEHLPYGGVYAEPVPHLTVAVGLSRRELASIAQEVEPRLPLVVNLAEAWLFEHRSEGWRAATRLPLGGR